MSYSARILSLTPLLYLPLDEASGSSFADATGNGHTGAIAPPYYVTAGAADSFLTGEKAAAFTRRDAEIDFDAGSGFGAIGHWTLEYWVQVIANAIDAFDVGFLFAGPHRIAAHLQEQGPANALQMEVDWTGAPTSDIAISDVITVPHVNCWNHWAFTYDGVRVKTYLNGTLVDPAPFSSLPSLSFTPSAGGGLLNAGGATSAFTLAHVAFYGSALSDADVAANYAAATPRQDARCFIPPIRLRHGTGHVVFESDDATTRLRAMDTDALTHDGTTMSVYGGGAERLRVPLPSAPAPPSRWVGIDPAGGLAVHDILPVTATHSISPIVSPVPPVTTPTTCDQMRCGAAVNMTGHLLSLYQHWAGVLNPLSSIAIKLGVGAAIAAGGELILSAFGIAELAGAIFESITTKLTSLLSALAVNIFASPTPDEQQVVQNGAYCALTCDGNVINPTAAQIQAWSLYLTNNSSAFSSLNMELALFNALLEFTPLLDWQLQAQTATPNSSCGTMTCP